jgi:hypothetical protein
VCDVTLIWWSPQRRIILISAAPISTSSSQFCFTYNRSSFERYTISPQLPALAMSDAAKTPYPFQFAASPEMTSPANTRGRIPSLQTSRLRTMMLEAYGDPTKILAFPCSYDGLSSRLIEEAGFPMLFLWGFRGLERARSAGHRVHRDGGDV